MFFITITGIFRLKWDYYIFWKTETFLVKMIFFTLPFKTIQENFLNIGMTFCIEKLINSWRKLKETSNKSIFYVSLTIYILGQIIILLLTFISHLKKTRQSLLEEIRRGLSTFTFKSIVYFLHYYLLWILLMILYLVTPISSSEAIWGVLFGFQVIAFGTHFLKLYSSWHVFMLSILWELQILFVIFYLFLIHFIDQSKQR